MDGTGQDESKGAEIERIKGQYRNGFGIWVFSKRGMND